MQLLKNVGMDIYYSLGPLRKNYRDIPGYKDILARLGMPDIPDLWGMGDYHEVEGDRNEFLRESLRNLPQDAVAGGLNAALIICSSNTYAESVFVSEMVGALQAINGSSRFGLVVPICQMGCANYLSAVEIGNALLQGGYESVLVLGADIGSLFEDRLTNYCIFSDFFGALYLKADARRQFQLGGICSTTVVNDIQKSELDGFDKAQELLFSSMSQTVSMENVAKLFTLNVFKPISSLRFKKLGLTEKKIDVSMVAKIGHCGGFDPFISLVEYAVSPACKITDQFILNAQGAGRSTALALCQNKTKVVNSRKIIDEICI